MKHVFIIHSSITYLASLSIIAEEGIREADAIILCLKEMQFEEVLPITYFPREKRLNRRTLSAKQLRKYIDDRCERDDYCLYIPVMDLTAKILVTSPKCKQLCFFEEGTAAYVTNYNLDTIACEYFQQKNWTLDSFSDYKNLLSRVFGLFLRGVTLRLVSLPFHYVEYALISDVIFYCFNERTFPFAKNKKVIDIHNSLTAQLSKHTNIDNGYIWVSSGFFENTYQPFIKRFYQEKLSTYLKTQEVRRVFIKFHQGESDFSRKITFDMFNEIGIDYEVLDDSTIMEIELLNSQNVTMLGDVSSLLMYNASFGHKSISIIQDLDKSSDKSEGFSLKSYFCMGDDFYQIMHDVLFI